VEQTSQQKGDRKKSGGRTGGRNPIFISPPQVVGGRGSTLAMRVRIWPGSRVPDIVRLQERHYPRYLRGGGGMADGGRGCEVAVRIQSSNDRMEQCACSTGAKADAIRRRMAGNRAGTAPSSRV